MVRLSDGKKFLMICLFVLTQLTNVTDGQTDRQRMTAKIGNTGLQTYALMLKTFLPYSQLTALKLIIAEIKLVDGHTVFIIQFLGCSLVHTVSGIIRMIRAKNYEKLFKFVKVKAKILSFHFFRTRCSYNLTRTIRRRAADTRFPSWLSICHTLQPRLTSSRSVNWQHAQACNYVSLSFSSNISSSSRSRSSVTRRATSNGRQALLSLTVSCTFLVI